MSNYIQVSIWLLIAAGCYQTLVRAQLFERGNCPEVKAFPDFNLNEVSSSMKMKGDTVKQFFMVPLFSLLPTFTVHPTKVRRKMVRKSQNNFQLPK